VIDSSAAPLDQDDPIATTTDAEAEAGAPSAAAVTPPSADVAPTPAASTRTAFAHASEAEMARILEFYEVRWEYEPTTFPILWNVDGDVIESFAPDFYLPDLDMYLELTTLQQRLVRKKNRKLRRLRELYPDVRIKLFYARDFRAMVLKYGRLGLAASLSGSVGQLGAIRPVEADPIAGGPSTQGQDPATSPVRSAPADQGRQPHPVPAARRPKAVRADAATTAPAAAEARR
jgi:hypothetical protein